jgi:hypothetical protein
MKFLGRVMIF